MRVAFVLVVVAFFIFEFRLHEQSEIFRGGEAVIYSVQWMLLPCLAFWCGIFIFLTFSLNELPLMGLLVIAVGAFFIGYSLSLQATGAVILLAGVTLGKGARFVLGRKAESTKTRKLNLCGNPRLEVRGHNFFAGLLGLLAFSSWWHLDMSDDFYHGPRWMGLWNNPNIYGMLMGAGVVLAVGLLAENLKAEIEENRPQNRNQKMLTVFLLLAAGMTGAGLVCSYSRGAWLGTAAGLLYLARAYKKFKWRWIMPGFLVAAAVVMFFWNATPDSAPWYLKRLDFGRPSAQHRVSAWRGALEMMRDHPLGVGWNKAAEIYAKDYSPPEDGAAAITTNDYFMLGTQLGWPGLICFVAYVGLALRQPKGCEDGGSKVEDGKGEKAKMEDRGGRMGETFNIPHSTSNVQVPSEAVLLGKLKMGERDTSPRPSPHFAPPTAQNAERGKRSQRLWKYVRCGWWKGGRAGSPGGTPGRLADEAAATRCACRAGAVSMLVAFWFDGGLFTLATGAVFWILLELGKATGRMKD
jgi:hypothetical protein